MEQCPESIEELERQYSLCKIVLAAQAEARLEAGTAKSIREASRQLGEELGENPETVRQAIKREKKSRMGTPVPRSEFEDYGPLLNEGDELPPEYQELDRIGAALNLELLGIEFPSGKRNLRGINNNVAWFLRYAYARNNIPEEIKEWFGRNRRERGEDGKCWICTKRKAQSKKIGLCARCREIIEDDRRRIEIQGRTICEEQTRACNELKEDFDALIEKVDAALEGDSPPRIKSALAEELLHYGKTIHHGLIHNLEEVANQHCFT